LVTLVRRMRERRVFRGAGYYIVGAWALLQVGDVVVEPAGLPTWSMTALLYLLILGFPLAIFLSWRYDITEHGIVRTMASGGEGANPDVLQLRIADYLILAMLLGILGFVGYRSLIMARDAGEHLADGGPAIQSASAAPLESIAVLPFADLSPGEEKAFLGDGISDTVTHVLSQVDGIQVIARTSSFAFKNRNLPVQEIAAALKVAHILEGSVQRAGDKLRIIARLINAATGAEVWSGYYDRSMEGVFAIQDEIAQEVATALRVTVLGQGDVDVEPGYRPKLAAFEAFILGREALDRGGAESLGEAVEQFQRAVDIDPGYALAYVMLGKATAMTSNPSGGASRRDAVEASGAFVRKALDLDPLLPEAHVGQASYQLAIKEFAGAERSARRALELSPSHPEAYETLHVVFWVQGQYDEALAMARRAAELDPEDDGYQLTLANALWSVGRSEASMAKIRQVLERDPRSLKAMTAAARYLRQLGRSGEALYWDERALALDSRNPSRQFTVCLGILQLWDLEAARSCVERHLEAHPQDPEARHYHALLTGNAQAGIANAREQVEANPNFWYRKMQLLDWLVVDGANEEALAVVRSGFPELLEDPPRVRDMTVWVARNLAVALAGLGQTEQARAVNEAGLAHLEVQRKLQGSALATGIDDVYFLANLGALDEAIDRLSEAIDRDWQFYSFGLLFEDFLPAALVADPRFDQQVERLAAIMAEERAWYEANRDRDLLGDA